MQIRNHPPLHLTYCLNIHRGETWPENFRAIRDKALVVRDAVAAGQSFGLGLRLSAVAAAQLADETVLGEFRTFLGDQRLYAFTINGFPYGAFHGTPVKQDVYRPDWRAPERRDYTNQLADILSRLLPDGVMGSISTVPGSYRTWISGDEDVFGMAKHLAEAAWHCHRIAEARGREIVVALEPEPDCWVETTQETVTFLNDSVFRLGGAYLRSAHGLGAGAAEQILRRHLGACLDTVHAAVEFEDPSDCLRQYAAAGVRVPKVQLGCALGWTPSRDTVGRLRAFAESVYLHQVKVRDAHGGVTAYPDLPEALAAWEQGRGGAGDQWRVHFHIPLFAEPSAGLCSTGDLLGAAFARALAETAVPHLEIETYTFDVLPDELRGMDVTASIAAEYRWVLARLVDRG
ncbi:MAG: hypothetical protein A3K19_22440 [Lentisphaerae bacterium RIFOXYB12_FULL_65_16]|nr:MAG: hypothetical protein A3K18_09860 [Lentisphaerae bacterium RIFOXYA12_64_32]OGV91856.1 MAG: hypothetical protein A3K19_22440 [Lentisphaerae bacterium RIFOXYB12_FULL_65_16]